MAVITELKMRGKKLVEVFVDDVSTGKVSVEAVVANGLKSGCEVDFDKLKKIQHDSTLILAKERALNIVSKNFQTESDVKNKLKKAGFDNDVCEETIAFLKSYNYLNDENYAKIYIDSKKHKNGKNKLACDLMKKGVKRDIIDSLLADLESDKEEVFSLLKKFMSGKEKDLKNKTKAYRFLYSRGFSTEDCMFCINKYFGEDYDWN